MGSYPTVSPLPSAEAAGGLFSVALSVTARVPCPGVTWRPAHGARTFLDGTHPPRLPGRAIEVYTIRDDERSGVIAPDGLSAEPRCHSTASDRSGRLRFWGVFPRLVVEATRWQEALGLRRRVSANKPGNWSAKVT